MRKLKKYKRLAKQVRWLKMQIKMLKYNQRLPNYIYLDHANDFWRDTGLYNTKRGPWA